MRFYACPDCDLLLRATQLNFGDKAHCPRCDCLLQRPAPRSIERSLALALTGVLLAIAANALPLLGMRLLGNSSEATLWTGVMALYQQDLWGVAALVFLTSIAFPIVNLILALLVSGHLFFHQANPYLPVWLRCWQYLNEWAMLEVYMLGIIVACVKLSAMADLKFAWGLVAFIALLLINAQLNCSLDAAFFWQRIKTLNKTDE